MEAKGASRPRLPPPALAPAACVALVAVAVTHLLPLISPLLVALVAGIVVANVGRVRERAWHDPVLTRVLLRGGVVLLGLRLSLTELGDVGVPGLLIAVAVVLVTFAATWVVGRRLGLDAGLVALVAAGFSVCGAAAIAAVESGVRRRAADVAVAIALVTAFGTAMIPTLPLLSALVGLDDVRAGVWIGASVHEVAQVVGSAALLGPAALAPATTVKLARVALLGVVFVACRRLAGGGGEASDGPVVPWFVVAFAAAVVVRSTGLLPTVVLDGVDVAASLALAAAMFGLGATVTVAAVRQVERRTVALAAWATLVATGVSLVGVLLLLRPAAAGL